MAGGGSGHTVYCKHAGAGGKTSALSGGAETQRSFFSLFVTRAAGARGTRPERASYVSVSPTHVQLWGHLYPGEGLSVSWPCRRSV